MIHQTKTVSAPYVWAVASAVCVCARMCVCRLTPVYLQTHNKYRINNSIIIIIIIITNTTVRIVIEGTSIAVGDPHTDT